MIEVDMDALAEAVDRAFGAEPEHLAKILRRARKALAIAGDAGAGEHERTQAKEMAEALISRYGITAAMLADRGQMADTVTDDVFKVVGAYALVKVAVLAEVVRAYGGDLVYKSKSPRDCTMHVFGMGSDMTRIKMLWESLLVQMEHEMRTAVEARTDGSRRDVFERSFILAFGRRVGERIRAAEAKARAEAQAEADAQTNTGGADGGRSVALVLADRRQKTDAALRRAYPKLRKERRSWKVSGQGTAAGDAAGARAELGGHSRLSGGAGRAGIGS